MPDNENSVTDDLITKIAYAMVHILMDMRAREDSKALQMIYRDLAEEISDLAGYGGISAH